MAIIRLPEDVCVFQTTLVSCLKLPGCSACTNINTNATQCFSNGSRDG